jgi:hypothetical protein
MQCLTMSDIYVVPSVASDASQDKNMLEKRKRERHEKHERRETEIDTKEEMRQLDLWGT